MESFIVYGSFAIIGIAMLGYVIFELVKFFKMSKEEKRKTIVSYLVGLVTMAEEKIGSGHGEEKLAEVERYFKENAGLFYKIILKMFCKESLKDLIEEALRMVKNNFGKWYLYGRNLDDYTFKCNNNRYCYRNFLKNNKIIE